MPKEITVTLTLNRPEGEYTEEHLKEWVEYELKGWSLSKGTNPLTGADFCPKTIQVTPKKQQFSPEEKKEETAKSKVINPEKYILLQLENGSITYSTEGFTTFELIGLFKFYGDQQTQELIKEIK
jgi:hypothetical protein